MTDEREETQTTNKRETSEQRGMVMTMTMREERHEY